MKYLKLSLYVLVFLVVFVIGLFFIDYLAFQLWIQGGKFVTNPDVNILATAEYLYANPPPRPNQMSILHAETQEGYLCVSIGLGMGNYWFNRWFVNGERVPYEMYHQVIFNESYSDIYCLEIYELPSGLHLVEIQVNESPFYTAMSYQWAIKIEPTSTPTPSPTPPEP